jgi:hypothetical protein
LTALQAKILKLVAACLICLGIVIGLAYLIQNTLLSP